MAKPTPKRRYRKDADVLSALLNTHGDVEAAAKGLGISRQALYERLRNKPHLKIFPVRSYTHAPRLTDEECEELVEVILGGRKERYVWYRETISTLPQAQKGTHYEQIAKAVEGTLNLPRERVIQRLKRARLELEKRKQQERAATEQQEEVARILRAEEKKALAAKRRKWRRRREAFLQSSSKKRGGHV
jgi:hypothetical protein